MRNKNIAHIFLTPLYFLLTLGIAHGESSGGPKGLPGHLILYSHVSEISKLSFWLAPFVFFITCMIVYYKARSASSFIALVGGLICLAGSLLQHMVPSLDLGTTEHAGANSTIEVIGYIAFYAVGLLVASLGLLCSLVLDFPDWRVRENKRR